MPCEFKKTITMLESGRGHSGNRHMGAERSSRRAVRCLLPMGSQQHNALAVALTRSQLVIVLHRSRQRISRCTGWYHDRPTKRQTESHQKPAFAPHRALGHDLQATRRRCRPQPLHRAFSKKRLSSFQPRATSDHPNHAPRHCRRPAAAVRQPSAAVSTSPAGCGTFPALAHLATERASPSVQSADSPRSPDVLQYQLRCRAPATLQ